MKTETKEKEKGRNSDSGKKFSGVRLATMLWVFFFPLLFCLLTSGPPAKVPAYIVFACLALVPLICGSRGYRVFGFIALIISLLSAVIEYRDGIRHTELRNRIKQSFAVKEGRTNGTPMDRSKP